MSETTATSTPQSTGVQGLAMITPLIGAPVLLHAVCGAVVAGAVLTPLVGPAALPMLQSVASKGDLGELGDVVKKLLPGVGVSGKSEPLMAVPVSVKPDESASTASLDKP